LALLLAGGFTVAHSQQHAFRRKYDSERCMHRQASKTLPLMASPYPGESYWPGLKMRISGKAGWDSKELRAHLARAFYYHVGRPPPCLCGTKTNHENNLTRRAFMWAKKNVLKPFLFLHAPFYITERPFISNFNFFAALYLLIKAHY
jgi:hypothetical protein